MSNIDTVRVLIPDLDSSDYMFTNEQLQSLLDLYNNSARLAAASAIDAVAANEALTYKYVKTDDLTVDGSKGVAALQARARGLRDEELGLVNDEFQVVYPLGRGRDSVELLWG